MYIYVGVTFFVVGITLIVAYCYRRQYFMKKYRIILNGRRPKFIEIINLLPNGLEEATLANPNRQPIRSIKPKFGILEVQILEDDIVVLGIEVPERSATDPESDPAERRSNNAAAIHPSSVIRVVQSRERLENTTTVMVSSPPGTDPQASSDNATEPPPSGLVEQNLVPAENTPEDA